MIDATVYPRAVGHKRSDVWKDLGLNVMYDRVLKVNSKDAAGNVYPSTESRYGIGGVFRHALHRTAMAPVVIPNVKYSIIEPGAGLRYPLTPKLCAGVDAKFMLITSAGQIETASQYGPGTVLGVEGALAADYLITPNLFARVAFRFETIGLRSRAPARWPTCAMAIPPPRTAPAPATATSAASRWSAYLY